MHELDGRHMCEATVIYITFSLLTHGTSFQSIQLPTSLTYSNYSEDGVVLKHRQNHAHALHELAYTHYLCLSVLFFAYLFGVCDSSRGDDFGTNNRTVVSRGATLGC